MNAGQPSPPAQDDTRAAASVGVLLVNLGSPVAPTVEGLRCYLQEFLSDRRVVDWPRWVWMPILKGIILRTRPPKSAAMYQRVWTDAGSPLVVTTRAQAEGVREHLGPDAHVTIAMRYGLPSLEQALDELDAAGCERIVLLPLFPQDSDSTTGSVVARVRELLAARPGAPALHVVPPFPDHAGYVAALAERTREAARAFRPDHHVFSFHGLPERYVTRKGDPYRDHCEATARALARELRLDDEQWTLAWQSKFGPERWLQPSAEQVARELAGRAPRVLVSCPGFVAGCLETIDEIGNELARTFREAGGEALALAPAVDASPAFVEALADLVRASWPRAPQPR